ncbi:MAG: hypothetical protein N2Z60_09775, partial [Elusimicrobiales bacterium]|nr:hypothetical protein [Elusimicrobiales bacterium]
NNISSHIDNYFIEVYGQDYLNSYYKYINQPTVDYIRVRNNINYDIEKNLFKLEKALDIEKKIIMENKHRFHKIINDIKRNCVLNIEKMIYDNFDYDTKLKIKNMFERIMEKNRENTLLAERTKKEVYSRICRLKDTAKFF